MTTLIEKEALLKKIETGALLFQPEVREIIEEQPEALVRCKDCKWFEPSHPWGTIEPIAYRCRLYGTFHIPEFFCSVGERGTDE